MRFPKVNVHDPRQNEFVQDWLTAYSKEPSETFEQDRDAIELVIEIVQETYSPPPKQWRHQT